MNDSVLSEFNVIGGICQDVSVLNRITPFLLMGDFTDERCAKVFEEAVSNRKTFDVTVAAQVLVPPMTPKEAYEFIIHCVDSCPTVAGIEYHAKKVHEAARLKRLRDELTQAMMECPDCQSLADAVAGAAHKVLQEDNGEGTTMNEALVKLLQDLSDNDPKKLKKLNTGFVRLDKNLKGLRAGQLVVVAARPGVGKSAFLLNLALNTARVGKVILFSLEMTADEIATRGIVTKSPLTLDNFLDDEINDKNMRHVVEPAGEISKLYPIILDDRPALTIEQLRARVRLHPDARLVIVDYLQLMQAPKRKEGRNWELGELTRSLKNFAVECGIPIIVAAQLNRDSDDTERPSIRSIRDSGEIEAHASKVLLMWKTGKDNLVAVDVAKNRQGRTGVTQFEFDGQHMTFTESPLKYEGQPKKKRGGFYEAKEK